MKRKFISIPIVLSIRCESTWCYYVFSRIFKQHQGIWFAKSQVSIEKDTPIMVLRNIDPKDGLCNSTRLQVIQLANHVIQTNIITCNNVDNIVLIPRMFVMSAEGKFPFRMRQRIFSCCCFCHDHKQESILDVI